MKEIGWNYIHEALSDAEDCFLCHLESTFERSFIDSYLSEHVMDAKTRQKVIESRGFCNYHFYKMFASTSKPISGDGLGMALTLKSVAEQLLEDIKGQQNIKFPHSKHWFLNLRNNERSILALKLSRIISNEFKCPACNHVSEMIQIYIEAFLRGISLDENLWKLYESSNGMCIPHYAVVLQVAANLSGEKFAPLMKKLAEKQIQTLERALNKLSEYVEKQDYQFSSEERAKTEKTIGESLTKVVGKRGTERTLMNMLKMGGVT